MDRIGLIMRRRGGTGEVVDFIDRNVYRLDNIMANEAECVVAQQVAQIIHAARREIVQANDGVSVFQQALTKM